MPSLCALLLAVLARPQGERYVHAEPGFELELPGADWKKLDQGAPGVLALVFTPVGDMTTRC